MAVATRTTSSKGSQTLRCSNRVPNEINTTIKAMIPATDQTVRIRSAPAFSRKAVAPSSVNLTMACWAARKAVSSDWVTFWMCVSAADMSPADFRASARVIAAFKVLALRWTSCKGGALGVALHQAAELRL